MVFLMQRATVKYLPFKDFLVIISYNIFPGFLALTSSSHFQTNKVYVGAHHSPQNVLSCLLVLQWWRPQCLMVQVCSPCLLLRSRPQILPLYLMNTVAVIATYTNFSEVGDWMINVKLSILLIYIAFSDSLAVLIFAPI
jgi:hypothetical protein